jgi:SAM-dependent methyltransferase
MNDFADRIVGHYERHAAAWDQDRRNSAWNDEVWHELFVEMLPKRAKVLDLGCGAGCPVAQYLAEQGVQVTGVDSSPTMISLCRSRLPDHEWIVADMRGLSLGRRFDGILGWDSFFHLGHDDQRRMFAVFAQHASSSAILMFNAGLMHGEGIGSYRGDPLYHASLAPEEYEALLRRFGFEVIRTWPTMYGLADERCGSAHAVTIHQLRKCRTLQARRHRAASASSRALLIPASCPRTARPCPTFRFRRR